MHRVLALWISALAALLIPAHAVVAAPIFSCLIEKSDAVLSLSDANGMLSFRYGPDSMPGISLRVPRKQARIAAWDGADQYHTYLVSIRNADYIYTIYTSYDDLLGFDTMGLTVEHRDVFIANHKCRLNTVKGDLVEFVVNHKNNVRRL